MNPASRDRTANAKLLADARANLRDAGTKRDAARPLKGFRRGRHPTERLRRQVE